MEQAIPRNRAWVGLYDDDPDGWEAAPVAAPSRGKARALLADLFGTDWDDDALTIRRMPALDEAANREPTAAVLGLGIPDTVWRTVCWGHGCRRPIRPDEASIERGERHYHRTCLPVSGA